MPRPRKVVDIRERLASFLAEHSDPTLGITNVFVKDACLSICPQIAKKKRGCNRRSVYFSGVYSSYALQSAPRMAKGKKCSVFVINLMNSNKKEETGHFVALRLKDGGEKSHYIDSFGKMCENEDVKKFLSIMRVEDYNYLCEPLQHELSTACGLYVLLYALAAESDMDIEEMEFLPCTVGQGGEKKGRKENDKIAIEYINRILDEYNIHG